MPNRIVGLDISSRRLLGVEIEGSMKARPKLVRAHSVPLPEGAARDSEVVDTEAVSNALRQLWSEGGFRSKRVVLGVGNQRVLVRELSIPVMPNSELREALQFHVSDLLPVPVDETILDFYPIEQVEGSAPAEMRGLLVAAISENIDANVATLERAGLVAAGIDLAPFAMIRSLTQGQQLTGIHTVVLIGSRTTYIVVTKHGVPQFVRIVPAGGENITDALSEATGLSTEEVTSLKFSIGIEPQSDPQQNEYAEIMSRAFRSLFGSILSTNTYFLTNNPGAELDGVCVLGSETLVPGVVQGIAEFVGVPAVAGDPIRGVQVGSEITAETLVTLTSELAIPVGLALGSK